MLIPAGSEFTVVFQGSATLLKSMDEIISEMTPFLSNNNLTVNSSNVAGSGALSIVTLGAFGVDVVTLDLSTAGDTDDITVTSEVAQAYQLVTKANPVSISIPQIGGTLTGQSAPSGISPTGIEDTISGFFGKLQTAGTSLLIGLAAVVIIVLLIVAYGPNVKHVASAL